MDSGQVSSLANFIGIVTGGGALLGFALYRAHLPKWRYQGLEDVLKRTEEMWAAESHLIANTEARESIKDRLEILHRDVYAIRERSLRNITLMYQYKELFKGLTLKMNRTYSRIENLRAEIIAEQRRSPNDISIQDVRDSPTTIDRHSNTELHSEDKHTTRPYIANDLNHEDTSSNTVESSTLPTQEEDITFRLFLNAGRYPVVIGGQYNDFGRLHNRTFKKVLNFVGMINNYLQGRGAMRDIQWEYEMHGPPTMPSWTATLTLKGIEIVKASGATKSAATNEAARQALDILPSIGYP